MSVRDGRGDQRAVTAVCPHRAEWLFTRLGGADIRRIMLAICAQLPVIAEAESQNPAALPKTYQVRKVDLPGASSMKKIIAAGPRPCWPAPAESRMRRA